VMTPTAPRTDPSERSYRAGRARPDSIYFMRSSQVMSHRKARGRSRLFVDRLSAPAASGAALID
jgi:hypothetical protein